MKPVKRSDYDRWWTQIGRPNGIPYRPRGRTRARARQRIIPGIAYYPTAFGDIQCGDRSTPPTEDAIFSSSTEQWRDLVSSYAGTIPLNFLMAWIQIESCGNPCSYTKYAEAGVFQLMSPDNIAQAQTTLFAIHPSPPCTPGVQTTAYYSSLTDDQRVEQVASGLRYVNFARDQVHKKLAAAGQDWSEDTPDFWMMVKQYHALPAIISPGLASAAVALGRPPENWAEFKMGSAAGYDTSNAQWTGSFGIGGGGTGSTLLTIATLLGVAYIAYELSS